MKSPADEESRAIERLITQINEIGRRPDVVGLRVVWAFGLTFAAALCLLAWVALFSGPPRRLIRMEGPRAPAVLEKYPAPPRP